MKLTANVKRMLSALLVFVLVLSMIPMNSLAATDSNSPIDAAIIFTDLHTSKSNYKQSNITGIMGALKASGLPFSTVTSGGDAFSVNEDSGKYTGYTSTITGYIRNGLGDADIPVNYVWSDHDRYAVDENGDLLDKTSHLVYGAGNDGIYGTADDGNYYIYMLSMGDISTNDRYNAGFSSNRASNGFTATVAEAISNFKADAAKLLKDRPLLIVSHQPLLDNRNDNGYAYDWATAINAVAEDMDVAFFFGHNHKYDKASDYYYAKGSTMSVCSDSSGNAKSVKLNFAHICGGYMEPTSTGSYSSSGTRRNVAMAVVIYEDSIQFVTYTNTGVYTGNYALNETVTREHANVTEQPEEPETPTETTTPTDPEEPTETTPIEPEEPETPDEPVVSGKIWRLATSIEAGKRYMLVNYGYNGSGIQTYAVDSSASPMAVTVQTDATGAYIVNDDLSLAWVAGANNNQFELANAQTGYYLRAANYVYGTNGSDITVNQNKSSGSTYTNWSLEAKNGSQVLAVRRATSSNYYPVRYTGSGFQAFNSSQVGSMNNWLAVFVETEENAHQHSFETVTVDATCTQDGTITTSCACGQKTVEVISATGHKYTCVQTDATCAQAGSKVYTCSVCADSYTEEIPATGNHSYETTIMAATCTQDGSKTNVCGVCGHTSVEVIPATGHSYNTVVTAPTCTEDGYTTYTCGCGDSYVADKTAALGHSYTAVVTDPSCTKEGSAVYTCHCGDSYTEVIPATGEHKYVATTVEPTCTEDGHTTYTCDCGSAYSEVIAATGHSYKAVVTAPTCTEDGYTTYTCACGDSYIADQTAALGHSYSAVVTAPTCTEDGYTTYTCACGDSYITDVVSAKGHQYTAVITAPSCTESGCTTYTCAACGDSYVADLIAALGHDHTAVVTAPTCTEEGYTTYTCATCGHSYIGNTVAALGHDHTAVVTAPTCTEDGYTTYTCACGDSYTGNTVAATGHSYTTQEVDGYLVYTCHCGHSYSEKLEKDLSYVKTSSLSSGKQVITFVSGNKYYALSHKDNKLSAVRVTVSGSKITSEVTDDLIWNYSGNVLSYENNGTVYYLYSKAGSWFSSPTLTISTTQSTTVSLSGGKLKLGSYYLRYSSSKVSLNRSGTTVGLFKETEN